MLSCCDGNGLKHFEKVAHDAKPFSRYHTVRACAHSIGCKYLEDKMTKLMTYLASAQIHSEDVRALYLSLPRDSEDLQFLARHVAMHIFNGTLRTKSAYLTLREEIPTFDDDVNAILNPLVAERNEQRKADRSERSERAEETKQMIAATVSSMRNMNVLGGRQNKIDEGKTVHKTVTLPQVRQKQAGRPAQYRLDLGEVLDQGTLTRTEYRGPRPRPYTPRQEPRQKKAMTTSVDTNENTTTEQPSERKSSTASTQASILLSSNSSTAIDAQTSTTTTSASASDPSLSKKVHVDVPGADPISTRQRSSTPANRNARRRMKKRTSTAAMEGETGRAKEAMTQREREREFPGVDETVNAKANAKGDVKDKDSDGDRVKGGVELEGDGEIEKGHERKQSESWADEMAD
jgi:hypothetical protein